MIRAVAPDAGYRDSRPVRMRCWVSTPAVAQAPPGGQAEPSGIAVLDPAVRPGVPVNVPDAGRRGRCAVAVGRHRATPAAPSRTAMTVTMSRPAPTAFGATARSRSPRAQRPADARQRADEWDA
jgi:hypothetical protein